MVKQSSSMRKPLTNILKAFMVISMADMAFAEKEGNRYHPVISWTSPLETDDFKNWSFQATSVALNNRIVLNPNGNEMFGYMQNKWTFEATSWEMSIDFEVDHVSPESKKGKAYWQILYLKTMPD